MSFDSGPLDRYLNSAVGDDADVAAELRATFIASASDLVDLLQRARCDANWSMAALRLKGLAATFGVIPLIQLAEQAMAGAPGDPAVIRDMQRAIGAIAA
jgi:HPt (histidine-containing phosphotransfer) domain-containing protein